MISLRAQSLLFAGVDEDRKWDDGRSTNRWYHGSADIFTQTPLRVTLSESADGLIQLPTISKKLISFHRMIKYNARSTARKMTL